MALIAGLEAGRLSPETIAEAASEVEIHGLGRPVGRQDQYLSALGGFRELHFHRGGVESAAIPVPVGFVRRLDAELLLFFTGSTRDAGTVLSQQNAGLEDDRSTQRRLHEIKELVPVARDALMRGDADTVGEVLGRHWEIKRTLGAAVAPGQVDRAYADARAAGATGGKLLGAGGGGFLLVHAPDAARGSVRTTLSAHGFVERAFRFERRGVELNRVRVPAGAAPADLSLRPS